MNFDQRVSSLRMKENNNTTKFPSFKAASKLAKRANCGILYFSRGVYYIVWFENKTRYSRDLKNWGIKGEFKPQVAMSRYAQRGNVSLRMQEEEL